MGINPVFGIRLTLSLEQKQAKEMMIVCLFV